MQGYEIQVTKDDITTCRSARQCDPRRCMIADAVQRAIPHALYIDVDLRYVRFSLISTQRRYFYDTPRRAMQALLDFDAGRPIDPFKFRIGRGYSIKRRSKQAGYVPSERNYAPTGKRHQSPRKRKFGQHSFDRL